MCDCSSVHVVDVQAIEAYVTASLSTEDAKLLADVRSKCEALKEEECQENVNAEYLKGLINVVPRGGARDKAGRCIAICWRNDKNCIPHCVALPFSWSRRIWFGVCMLVQTLLMPVLGQLSTPVVLNRGITLVSLTIVRCFSGHDCGVYVMVFMDLLSLGVKQPILPQRYVRQVRDNLLLSLLQGQVAHFPEAMT
ncbi:hypothetical protein Cgig2_029577 [Carnegiea gigantea]|uniref:Ubiquitin-like protease family profile domain-containing protein n=1 Tax=Carnegiea gigantea TaxID=171969 RepID=A0A9Q1Q7A8_9CARY|nr:hypothetical protein Cgig2_029577 [Carnegiea gigantea]